jgi:hypothetical protein
MHSAIRRPGDCSTGKSAGFAPLRILSTYSAALRANCMKSTSYCRRRFGGAGSGRSPTTPLEADAQCPDVPALERRLLPDDLPLFHGSRAVALSAVPMMVSHRVEGPAGCAGTSLRATTRRDRHGRPAQTVSFGVLPPSHAGGHERTVASGCVAGLRCKKGHRQSPDVLVEKRRGDVLAPAART